MNIGKAWGYVKEGIGWIFLFSVVAIIGYLIVITVKFVAPSSSSSSGD